MIAGLERRGFDLRPAFSAAGVSYPPPAAAARLPIERYTALYNSLAIHFDDEAFGIFEQPLRCGSFEFLCRAILSNPTLGAALEQATRFLRTQLPELSVTLVREGTRSQLRLAGHGGFARLATDDPMRIFGYEWLLRLLHALASWLVGRSIILEEVTFPFSAPAHVADHALIYSSNCRYRDDQASLSAQFSTSVLDLPVRRDVAALEAFLDGAPGRIAMLYRRDRGTVTRVRDLVRNRLPNVPTLREIAGALNLSSRTLHRRLGDEGSNLRAVLDSVRREEAMLRIVTGDHSIARIASDLGYADPSAFYRAFVAWTGESPSSYRKRR